MSNLNTYSVKVTALTVTGTDKTLTFKGHSPEHAAFMAGMTAGMNAILDDNPLGAVLLEINPQDILDLARTTRDVEVSSL